jgi:hypothetical protein
LSGGVGKVAVNLSRRIRRGLRGSCCLEFSLRDTEYMFSLGLTPFRLSFWCRGKNGPAPFQGTREMEELSWTHCGWCYRLCARDDNGTNAAGGGESLRRAARQSDSGLAIMAESLDKFLDGARVSVWLSTSIVRSCDSVRRKPFATNEELLAWECCCYRGPSS